ncbi:MAG: acetate--CoA ligase [Candidatus Hydrogenedentes bacterium]|nr:acetate--CoA ligase [Candidatus Hydrogenedentota bacterium]
MSPVCLQGGRNPRVWAGSIHAVGGNTAVSVAIDHVLVENRHFEPSTEFSKKAKVRSSEEYERMYRESIEDPEAFWGKAASELHWFKKWKRVLNDDNAPFYKWFEGGKTNVSYNCLDVHLKTWRKNKAAIIWEGEPYGQRTILTYRELHRQVCKFANALRGLGVKPGDRVAIYLPMIPELAIAMLACARIGAVHSIIFAGFSASALVDRINDAGASVVITSDGGYRRGQVVELKKAVDEALLKCPTVARVIVVERTHTPVQMVHGRDIFWHEIMLMPSDVCPPEELDAEHPLYILYTSGSTGKPKGILHTTGGYMVGTYLSSKYVFDLREEDTFWCSADIGWVTGHSYVIYGILTNGATTVMYEGAPNYPTPDRFWQIIERYQVTVFYTAPTAIRAFSRWGEGWPAKHDLSSLRLLGTVGEPINPEAWMWYHKYIGNERCPIVDTWWQTETGSIMITTLPGAMSAKPGSAGRPFFGVKPMIVDEEGNEVDHSHSGLLVLTGPWPAMLRTLYHADDRFKDVYWSKFAKQGWYFTGDGAYVDENGYYMIIGRIDDVINVSGHRLGTMEIESALVSHPMVAEAAVVGYPHEIKGQGVCAFVSVPVGTTPTERDKDTLREHVAKEIGAIAKPDQIRFTDALPKTRSGKIMRRLLRDVAAGRDTSGDTTTLEDFSVLAKLREDQEG